LALLQIGERLLGLREAPFVEIGREIPVPELAVDEATTPVLGYPEFQFERRDGKAVVSIDAR